MQKNPSYKELEYKIELLRDSDRKVFNILSDYYLHLSIKTPVHSNSKDFFPNKFIYTFSCNQSYFYLQQCLLPLKSSSDLSYSLNQTSILLLEHGHKVRFNLQYNIENTFVHVVETNNDWLFYQINIEDTKCNFCTLSQIWNLIGTGVYPDNAILASFRLNYEMRQISKKSWLCDWIIGEERELWNLLKVGGGSFGMMNISNKKALTLLNLSAQCGGWWIFKDDRQQFVPMSRWIKGD